MKDKNKCLEEKGKKGYNEGTSEAQALEILLFLWKSLSVDPCCPGVNCLFDKRGVEPIIMADPLGIKIIFKKSMPRSYKVKRVLVHHYEMYILARQYHTILK